MLEDDTDAILAAANVVLTASGTATVQTALHGTPMVIVYRVSPLTYRLLRRLVTVDTIGMVNLIAGERIVPELIQEAFTPATVAGEAISMLTDEDRVNRIRAGLARVREKLGGPGREPPRGGSDSQIATKTQPRTHENTKKRLGRAWIPPGRTSPRKGTSVTRRPMTASKS